MNKNPHLITVEEARKKERTEADWQSLISWLDCIRAYPSVSISGEVAGDIADRLSGMRSQPAQPTVTCQLCGHELKTCGECNHDLARPDVYVGAVGEIDWSDDGAFAEFYPDRDLPLGAKLYTAPFAITTVYQVRMLDGDGSWTDVPRYRYIKYGMYPTIIERRVVNVAE